MSETRAASAEITLCSVQAGRQRFGIETCAITEVLNGGKIHRVPRADAYVAGMVAHRGEVLTAISLRVVLGLAPWKGVSTVLVLEGQNGRAGEAFALVVDRVGGMEELWAERRQAIRRGFQGDASWSLLPICLGAFERDGQLLLQLDTHALSPDRLAQSMSQPKG